MIDRVDWRKYDAREGPFPTELDEEMGQTAIAARNLALRLGASDAVAGSTSSVAKRQPMVWTVWPTKLDVLDEFEKLKSVLPTKSTPLQNFLNSPLRFVAPLNPAG